MAHAIVHGHADWFFNVPLKGMLNFDPIGKLY